MLRDYTPLHLVVSNVESSKSQVLSWDVLVSHQTLKIVRLYEVFPDDLCVSALIVTCSIQQAAGSFGENIYTGLH